MNTNNDYIKLKWGTLKNCKFSNSPKSAKALEEYNKLGSSDIGMIQEDTDKQTELICTMIDNLNGYIKNDFTDEILTKEEAKEYILEYGN